MKERRFEPMEMEERDVVTFTDEEGNEFELDVIEYFEYEGQEDRRGRRHGGIPSCG